MTYYFIKLVMSAAVIVAVSETAKRSGYWGGVIASLPMVSILALTWLYLDTHDAAKVQSLARSTLWFVLPTLPFFLILPAMMQAGRGFWLSMVVAAVATAGCYMAVAALLSKMGVRL
jgi:hypothetical protein